jgi:hypothetical protein
MKLIIAGGRDYDLTVHDYMKLERIKGITEVVCGCAKGADTCGKLWAQVNKIPVKYFQPDWDLGKRAGVLRNRQMAEYADAVALFPGGRGTNNMFEVAKEIGLRIFDFRDSGDLLGGF